MKRKKWCGGFLVAESLVSVARGKTEVSASALNVGTPVTVPSNIPLLRNESLAYPIPS